MTGPATVAPAPALVTRARTVLRERAELVVLAVLVAGTTLLPGPVPLGIYGLGVVDGAALALQTIGIVLVYRSNRIINFAQVQAGAMAGLLFVALVQRRTFILGARYLCPTCIDVQSVAAGDGDTYLLPVNPPGWLVHANFWLAAVVSIALALVLTYAAYALVIRRFSQAPRLILTVVTIGLGQVFLLLKGLIPYVFDAPRGITGNAPFPFQWRLRIDPVTFGTTELLTLAAAVAALAGIGTFFARSNIGVALRGASESPQRAQSLGVNVGSVNAVVWLVAGGLSAAASVLAGTSLGAAELGGPGNLVRMLAAAVLAAMVSLPVAVLASMAIGVLDQAVLWTFDASAAVDGGLVLVVVVVLLLQRARAGRTDTEADGGWRLTPEMRPIPAELRDLDVVQRWLRAGRILLAAVLLGLPWILTPSQTNLAAVTLIYGMVGLSLLVLTGWAGQISLGQFAFAAVGGYVTALLGWPFPLPLVAGAVAGAATALVVGLPALRLRGLYLAISTLAFAVAVASVLLDRRYLGGALPDSLARPAVVGFDLDDQRTFYYFVLAFLALTLVAVVGLRRSRTARALIACRDNEPAAQSFGINMVRARLAAFALSGAIAAFAGGLFAFSQYDVAQSGFGVGQSIDVFLMAIIGGLGSVAGPLIGAAYVGATTIFSTNALVALGATGLGVVVLLLFAPGGLGELAYRVRDAMLRRVAERYRIEVPSLVADRRRGLGRRAPIAPRTRANGAAFVPVRYRATGQWGIDAMHRESVSREVSGG